MPLLVNARWTIQARCAAVLALVLLAATPASGAVPDDLAGAFPPGAVAYAEMNNLDKAINRLETSEYLTTVLASPQLQQLKQTPQYRKAQAARFIAERQFGIDPIVLLRKLVGRRVAVALYPNEKNVQLPDVVGLLATEPGLLAQLRAQLDPLLTLAEDAIQATPGAHGTELFSFGGKVFATWKDDWLAVSNRRDLLDDLVERLHGKRQGGLAQDESFRAMSEALAKTPSDRAPASKADNLATQEASPASAPLRLLRAYVNMAILNKAAGGRLAPEKLDNPVGSLLLGDAFEMALRGPFAAFILGELSSAVRAFYRDLQGHGLDQRVALATFSEFGRRVKENGSLGTDHGAASQMFVVTPKKGGVYGEHPSLTDLDDGDLKFHTDFRAPYATLLDKWLDLPSEAVLGQTFTKLDFV